MSNEKIKGNYTRNVTPEIVKKAKSLNSKYPDLRRVDLAELCGTSVTTVSRVINGEYDFLIEPPKPVVKPESVSKPVDLTEIISLLKENNELMREMIKMWREE